MIEFIATEIGCLEDLGVISCGASNADSTEEYHYINFQRPVVIGSPDDEGIYFEMDDQSCGGYNVVSSCELEPNRLTIRLSEHFKQMPGKLVVVRFATYSSSGLRPINEGLEKIFRGYESLFHVHA